MKRLSIAIAAVCALLCCSPPGARAQTVAPFMGVGDVQFFSNTGRPLNSGVLYSFEAGTSTQQPTYTDSTGDTLNPDPVPLSSSGRAAIWLLVGDYYKFVLCTQNDGASCAPGDTLFTVDNVPGSSGGGGSASSPFISSSPNPATTGILRLAASDQVCWRNTANNANLCLAINSNASLIWPGGSLLFPQISPVVGTVGSDLLWADSSTNRWNMSNNGAAADQVVGAATTDTLTNKTYDTAGAGNLFYIDGTPITSPVTTIDGVACTLGSSCSTSPALPSVVYNTPSASTNASIASTTMATASGSGDVYRFSAYATITAIGITCESSAALGVSIIYTDPNTSTPVTVSDSGAPVGMVMGTGSNGTLGRMIGQPGDVFPIFSMVVTAKAGSTVAYSTTYAPGTCGTVPSYQVYPVLELLQ